MNARSVLRVEGAAIFLAASAAFVTFEGAWWLYLLLLLAPDLGMLGYVAGPSIGSRTYNLVHTYTLPLLLVGVGWWSGTMLAVLVSLVWIAHIGIDRAIGYGLKYPTGFKDTHLDRLRGDYGAS